jgi:hypothetical protein
MGSKARVSFLPSSRVSSLLHSIETSFGAHPACNEYQNKKLTTHFHIMPRSHMSSWHAQLHLYLMGANSVATDTYSSG